ncbi:PP2C family protein-serine/threonine phosphatase [Brotaphodocola sp.]|uniref:PP2C family protein-serine/threonine phosphatase n=1 Tax=Brotaphodocola sp. TaxID=3073577 RepID=UPI003D7E3B3F
MSDSNVIERIQNRENSPICGAVYSIIGDREYQQDFAGLVVEEKGTLAVVCDGMGGLNGGEVASREAVRLLLQDYEHIDPKLGMPQFLLAEASRMDQLVSMMKDSNGKDLHAGSTVVSVIVQNGQLFWMSVGDSHIYVFRRPTMVRVTKDHNYRQEVTEALEHGEISFDQYEQELNTKKVEALTSYLGMGGLWKVERNLHPLMLEDGDEILLCSDGLYKSLEEQQIQALLEDNYSSVPVAVKRLVRMAWEQSTGHQDNTTAILLKYRKK